MSCRSCPYSVCHEKLQTKDWIQYEKILIGSIKCLKSSKNVFIYSSSSDFFFCFSDSSVSKQSAFDDLNENAKQETKTIVENVTEEKLL